MRDGGREDDGRRRSRGDPLLEPNECSQDDSHEGRGDADMPVLPGKDPSAARAMLMRVEYSGILG